MSIAQIMLFVAPAVFSTHTRAPSALGPESVDEQPALREPAPSPGWYYAVDGQQVGPLDDAAVGAAYLDGRIADKTPMWWEGADAWTAFAQTPRFEEIDRWYVRNGAHVSGPMSGEMLRAQLAKAHAHGRTTAGLEVRLAATGWMPVAEAVPLRGYAASFVEASSPDHPSAEVEPAPASAPAPAPEHVSPEFGMGRARVTITPRLGIAFPGQATPREVVKTKVGFGLPVHLDLVVGVGRDFEIGPYLHYSVRPITERADTTTNGQFMHLVSAGAVTKYRLRTSARSRLRIGALLGYNSVRQEFKSDLAEGTIVGRGLSFAPSLEWSIDVGRHVAFNTMLSMITQIWGRADLDQLGTFVEGGSDQGFPFPPLAFLTVGFDFGFGAMP